MRTSNLSKTVVLSEFEKLAITLRIENIEAVVGLYHEALSELSNDRFQRVCRELLKEWESSFLPQPAWFIRRAVEIAINEPLRSKALPFAEVEGVESKCPAYVRKYMQLHHDAGRQLWADLKVARSEARSRVAANGRKASPAQWALIDESEQVKAAKAAIDAWQEKGTGKGFDLHVKHWHQTEAHAEMTALAGALTPEEEIKYTFEFSVEEAITMPNFPPIREEASKPPPIVERQRMSYEPMSGVEIKGFSIGDEIECNFPSYYDKSDKRDAKNDYPWGERGEVIGFREDIGIGNRKSITAIVRFDSGVTRQIFEDMMTVTNTDF